MSTANLPLPRNWKPSVKAALVQVVALARVSMIAARAKLATKHEAVVEVDRRDEIIAQKDLQIKLLTARLSRVPSANRPRYDGQERLEILQLRAACGWSLVQTAKKLLVSKRTIMSWNRCLRDEGEDGLLEIPEPVNRFPDLVRQIVQQFKQMYPILGKVKIAQNLCRAGLHLGVTTVGRILKEMPITDPHPVAAVTESQPTSNPAKPKRKVTAKSPNHVWNIDLTAVPIEGGLSVPWGSHTLPQRWPFCWWVAIIMDHFSRRIVGFRVYYKRPTSQQIRHLLGQAIQAAKVAPKYLISDQGPQFICDAFREWCRRKKIKLRFGQVGQHGSIAVLERFNRTLKTECTRRIRVSYLSGRFRAALLSYLNWYNDQRPHMGLSGRTPSEVYFKLPPANELPRFEPRPNWPERSRCAKPTVPIRRPQGCRLVLESQSVQGLRHLPVVTLKAA